MSYDDVYETEDYKGFTITLRYDTCAGNPYREFDQMGAVVLKKDNATRFLETGSYIDMDYHYGGFAEAAAEWLADEDAAVVVPFYLVDAGSHGWYMDIAEPGMPTDRHTGFAFVSRKTLMHEYHGKIAARQHKAKAATVLTAELETWRAWLNGDVYGWTVEYPRGGQLEATWGYYGETDYALQEARETVDSEIAKREHEAAVKAATLQLRHELAAVAGI